MPGSSSPLDAMHQTATTPSPGGHTKGTLSAEEIRLQALEYQTPASTTKGRNGAAADDDADDVDWPAADQDIPEVIDMRSPREEQQRVIRDVLARTTAPAAAPNDPLTNLPRKYMTLGAALTSRRDALSPRSPDSAKLSSVDEPIPFPPPVEAGEIGVLQSRAAAVLDVPRSE